MNRKNRWYDQYPELSLQFERLKELNPEDKSYIFDVLKKMLLEYNPRIIDDHIERFSMPIKKRRWYDKEPYSWIIVNALKYVDKAMIDKVVEYLEENLNNFIISEIDEKLKPGAGKN